jgi:hypothetical protein
MDSFRKKKRLSCGAQGVALSDALPLLQVWFDDADNGAQVVTDLVEGLKTYDGALLKGLTGRQAYFLEVPGTASAAALSVVSFEAVERMGAPYTVTIQLTHPLELDRADYLGKAATFLIDTADGTEPRKFAGCITRFSNTRQTHDVCSYEIVVEALVARLRLTHASRIYLRMSSTGIEDGTRGERTIKSSAFSRQGPSSLAQSMNTWKHAKFNDAYVIRNPSTGEPLANTRVEILREDGSRLKMVTDSAGKTPLQKSLFVEPLRIRLLD